MNVPIVWVMGGPSSGKTTLAQSIVEKYGYKHVDINALIEHEIETNTPKGKEFAEVVNNGQLVPLAEVMPLVEQQLMSNKSGLRGFVIDGYPTNQADAAVLEQQVGTPDLVIALSVGQETIDTRRSSLNARASITAQAYMKNVKPVLDRYAEKTMQIDGDRDANEVFEDVKPNMEIINKNHGPKISIGR
ncbi:hypothetical protein AWZ03_000965 [Drosophila navojoa]|uniref:Uncharacterized protein n=1 Tax=Drosophila navojoa TaxID=7232 RepID=A0A484BXK4_DRONA|nr:adenylate kinase isoenzyme 5-like [Drosophila navojoa]TDG52732.1 hypothetical protein AWZ03_000965 [Drosophila navojoa]